jgi:hypothetical protein
MAVLRKLTPAEWRHFWEAMLRIDEMIDHIPRGTRNTEEHNDPNP